MPRAPDKEAKIPALQAELETLQAALDLGEGEHTWEKVDKGIMRFTAVVKGGGYKHANFVDAVGKHHAGLQLVGYMLSDKGKLSGTTIDLLTSFAPRLNTSFAPLVPLYLDPLTRLLGRPNKVFIRRAEHCLGEIIANCPLVSIIYELKKGLENDAPTGRRGCAAAMVKAVQQWPIEVWGEKGVKWLEDGIRRMGGDKDAEVRATGKVVWGLFAEQWPERVDDFAAPLSPTIKRRLDIRADAAAGGKGKIAVKASMAPPAVPHRTAPPAASSSASTSASASSSTHPHAQIGAPVRNGHARIKSTTQTRPIEMPPARRPAPASSAPTSPTKDKEHQPILSRSHTSRPEALGLNLGQPSRPVMHHQASSSSHRSPDKDIWSKPQRPQFTTSQSTSAVEDALSGPVRRFPPPSRGFRPPPVDDDLFNPSLAGPSVLRGPVRLPAPERAPPRLGPARRVVTAPYPTTQNPLAGPQRPTHPPSSVSHNDLAAVLKGARSVKKRVEALEEEIRVNSPAGSPLPPRPSSAMGLNTPPGSLILGQRRIPMDTLSGGKSRSGGTGKPGAGPPAVESPLLPVLARSVDGRREVQTEVDKDDDLRRVSSGQDLAELTVMDVTVMPIEAALDAVEGAEHSEAGENEESAGQGDTPDAIGEDGESEDDHGDHAMTSIVVDLDSEAEDGERQVGGEAEPLEAELTGATAVSTGNSQAEAIPTIETASMEREEAIPTGHGGQQLAEERAEGFERMDDATPDQDDKRVEHDTEEHDEHGKFADDGDEHHEAAKQVPLPSSPAKSTITLPDDEPEPAVSAPAVQPPPAPYPKEAPPRPRVVSRTGLTADTAATAARKAALPRKPALPPVARRPANERKPFKPTSGASKISTKPPVPPAPVARARVVSEKDAHRAESASTTRSVSSSSAAPLAGAKPAIPPNVARPPVARTAAVKPLANTKMNPPPMGVSGKGSTAPAVMARSVSAASSASASTTSRPPKEMLKPAVPKARAEVKPDHKPKAPLTSAAGAAAGSASRSQTRTNRPIASLVAGSSITTTAPAAVAAGAGKIRRKAPLPSFKPVKAKDKAAGAATSVMGARQGGEPSLRVATTTARRPPPEPESVPLPLSPGDKAKMAPKDIPLPRSPTVKKAMLDDDVEDEDHAEEGDHALDQDAETGDEREHGHGEDDGDDGHELEAAPESHLEAAAPTPVDVDDAKADHVRHDADDRCKTSRPDQPSAAVTEQAMAIPIPVDTLHSPTTTMRASSLRSSPSAASPLAVSQPRTVSPVLTVALQDSPPATPASTSHQRFSSSVSRALSHATSMGQSAPASEPFISPAVDSRSKLIDAPSPEDIPSPFLSAARRASRPRNDDIEYSTSSRFTSKRTEMADPDAGELEVAQEVLDGVTTTIGQESTASAIVRDKAMRRHGVNTSMDEPDLMVLSAGPRPAHGERKDVSTPVKGTTEVLLQKIAGKAGTPVERVPLALRDANTGGAVAAGAAEEEPDEED